MNVNPVATSTPATTNPTQQSMSGLTGDSFLTLLTAQLKSQDPTQPTDPTAFVGQLVQFNTLQQTIEMRQLLQQLADQGVTPTPVTTPAKNTIVPAQGQTLSQQLNMVA